MFSAAALAELDLAKSSSRKGAREQKHNTSTHVPDLVARFAWCGRLAGFKNVGHVHINEST